MWSNIHWPNTACYAWLHYLRCRRSSPGMAEDRVVMLQKQPEENSWFLTHVMKALVHHCKPLSYHSLELARAIDRDRKWNLEDAFGGMIAEHQSESKGNTRRGGHHLKTLKPSALWFKARFWDEKRQTTPCNRTMPCVFVFIFLSK